MVVVRDNVALRDNRTTVRKICTQYLREGGGEKAYTKSLSSYYYLISILVGVSMEVVSHVPPRSSPYTT